MCAQWLQEAGSCLRASLASIPVHVEPRIDKRAHQPWPSRSLVIGIVAPWRRPFVAADKLWMRWIQSTQAEGGQEFGCHDVNDTSCAMAGHRRSRESADRENLIRTDGVIGASSDVVDIDDVEQTVSRLVPESQCKRFDRAIQNRGPACAQSGASIKRINPERLDLDGLADARCDLSSLDSRIHPGQLHPWRAACQQAVGITADALARPARESFEDFENHSLEALTIQGRQPGAIPRVFEQLAGGHDKPQ